MFSKIKFTLTLGASLLLLTTVVNAQEKVTIDGKSYQMHKVEQGNTLYAISRQYNVPINAIIKANPEAEYGVRVGQDIKIPLGEMSTSEVVKKQAAGANSFLIHTVQKKETLYSLSKQYDVSSEEIIRLNPEAAYGLKINQQIKIPSDKKQAQTIDPKNAYPYPTFTHRVERQETLYSLSKEYQVNIEDIKKANNGLPDGLKKGSIILIPVNNNRPKSGGNTVEYTGGTVEYTNPTNTKGGTVDPSTYQKPRIDLDKPFVSGQQDGFESPAYALSDKLKVGLLLPFDLEKMALTTQLGNDQIALEFYQGALLAADSVGKMGFEAELFVFDTKKDATFTRSLGTRPELANANLIIGPMYKSEISAISDMPAGRNAHIVCPVPQSSSILINHSNIHKFSTGEGNQIKKMVGYISQNYANDNILIVSKGMDLSDKLGTYFSATYSQMNGDATTYVNQYYSEDFKFEDLETKLDVNRNTVIYVASNDLPFVTAFMTKAAGFADDYQITVFGNEAWMKFDQMEVAYKNKVNLHLPTYQYIDYNSQMVKSFIQAYKGRYNTEPNKYGFLGFDITYYYLMGLKNQGLPFLDFPIQAGVKLTSTKADFMRSNANVGLENLDCFILRYNNYKIQKVY